MSCSRRARPSCADVAGWPCATRSARSARSSSAPTRPGVPLLAPGERVTQESIDAIQAASRFCRVAYCSDPSLETILIVDQCVSRSGGAARASTSDAVAGQAAQSVASTAMSGSSTGSTPTRLMSRVTVPSASASTQLARWSSPRCGTPGRSSAPDAAPAHSGVDGVVSDGGWRTSSAAGWGVARSPGCGASSADHRSGPGDQADRAGLRVVRQVVDGPEDGRVRAGSRDARPCGRRGRGTASTPASTRASGPR